MNETIVATLREHADGEVHVEQLLDRVHSGVRRQRRRRRAWTGATLAGLVLAASFGLSGLGSGPSPSTVDGPTSLEPPRPPVADGLSVADSPDQLGADLTRLHLDVAGGLAGWTFASWSVSPGHEELYGTPAAGGEARLEVDRDQARLRFADGPRFDVRVDGSPAVAVAASDAYVVRWQLPSGLWAQATSPGDVHAAIDLAQRLRLDRVYRCVLPFTVGGAIGAQLTTCGTTYAYRGSWTASGLVWFLIPNSATEYEMAVYPIDPSIVADEVMAGRPVQVQRPTGSRFTVQVYHPYGSRALYVWAFGPPDEEVLRSLIAGFTPATGEAATWLSNPFTG